VATGVGQLTDVAWGGGPVQRLVAGRGDSLLPQGRVSHWRKGLRGFPLPPGSAIRALSRGEAAACAAPSRPVGGEGGGVRWCPPPLRLLLSPESSPPITLPPSRSVPPSLPPAASSCRCRCFGCCVIRPRAAGTEGLGLGTPRPPPTRPPTPGRALPAPRARPGLLRLPLPGSRRPQLSPVRRRREEPVGGVVGSRGSARRARAGEPRGPGLRFGLGRL
jgi:hypothetical protein